MGKEHKKHKKHKHSKHKHKSKNEEYHVPIVPLKSDIRPRSVMPVPSNPKENKPIGPNLPTGLSNTGDKSEPGGEQNDSYGPSLPPHLVPQKRVPGPSLPSDFKIEEKKRTDRRRRFGFRSIASGVNNNRLGATVHTKTVGTESRVHEKKIFRRGV